MGRYDAVVVMDLPDDTTAAKVALMYGKMGTGSTETLRAFDEAEYAEIVGALP